MVLARNKKKRDIYEKIMKKKYGVIHFISRSCNFSTQSSAYAEASKPKLIYEIEKGQIITNRCVG
ncbi:hypothetical protein C2I27_20065 [Priestia megaterium]|nr:hypothetical protein C2I27_20065 [Priestia megaterium]